MRFQTFNRQFLNSWLISYDHRHREVVSCTHKSHDMDGESCQNDDHMTFMTMLNSTGVEELCILVFWATQSTEVKVATLTQSQRPNSCYS